MGLLENKVAIITGASRGIGKAISQRFAAEGANVGLIARSVDRLEALRDELQATGVKVIVSPADVSDREQLVGAVEKCVDEFGGVDALVNNAGVARDNLVVRLSPEDWETVIRTNLSGAFYASQAVVRPMMRRRPGVIINISSIVGVSGNAGQANYAASKGGLIALTKSLAREMAPRGVRVNAVAPGFIATAMTDKIPAELRDKMVASIPLGRMGMPEDVARAVLFLASPDAGYITGQVLVVDGGMYT